MFTPLQFDEGQIVRLATTDAQTFVKGDRAKHSSGLMVVGASGDDECYYICLEDVVTTADNQMVEFMRIPKVNIFEALTSATPVLASHVGNIYDVTGKVTVDLGNTTDKVFYVEKIIDATNKLVQGFFMNPALA